jgi:hypothetical protein
MEHCKGTTQYHRPKTILETAEISHEYCENCKEEHYFKKHKGKIDNKVYGDFHKRETLQPDNQYFEREYKNN